MKRNNKVHIQVDGVDYYWENVPDEKYYNWLKMRRPFYNTDDYTAPGFPYLLQIEPSNMCNLSCPLCPVSENRLGRPPKNMTFEDFKSLVDDMERYLLFMILWDWGEPFMNPDLPKMIKYASERGIQTETSTNGHFLTKEAYVEELLRSGLTTLIVAIDSLDAEKYKMYRTGGSLDKAVAGLKNVCEIKKRLGSKTRINMRMVLMKQNEKELHALREFARELGADIFSVKTLNPSCGLSELDESLLPENPEYRRYEYKKGTYERIYEDIRCGRVWQMANVYSDGEIVPCCYDYACELKIGNIHDKPLSETWNSPVYRELRRKIYDHKDSIPKCKECTINYKQSVNGWFLEIRYFNAGFKRRILDCVKKCARMGIRVKRNIKSVLPPEAIGAIRKRTRGMMDRNIKRIEEREGE